MKKGLIVVIGIIVLGVMFLVSTYNGLITKSENVESKYANIDTQLQRRADLIPNLINTVKGYMKQENDIIEKVVSARENLVNAKGALEKSRANAELTRNLDALFVIVENYPDLKSSQNFINLQDELAGTENRISTARNDYNNAVKEYNTAIVKFPANIISKMFGLEKSEYFKAESKDKDVPKVNFE